MIGQSPQIRFLKSQLKRAADADARVMITGPNGSGKELVARSLHYKSARSEGPLVSVNCAAIPGDLIESILFGHEKGAYTGAYQASAGKFEKAHGGTIFLDEIGDMSLQAQAKVLRALEENKITRVGGQKEIPIDVRVISATNRDLFQMIAEKTFREDLYYRLAVVNLHVPPLNHRREDIPLLVNHFIHTFCTERGKPIREVTPEAMKALQEFDYRGNIRELRNIIERVLVLGSLEINADDIDNLVLSQVNPLRLHVQQLIYQLGGVAQLVTYIEKEFMKPVGQ
jgi:DNA-binding NtrC family response regulator